MLLIYKTLGIEQTTIDVGFDFQPAYDALIERYDPIDHAEEICQLSASLGNGEAIDNEHQIHILNTLKTIVCEKALPLPRETIELVSKLLQDLTHAEYHEAYTELLAYCAGCPQLLPETTLQILEANLAYSDDRLLSLTAGALSGALNNGQTLAPDILQLTEEALIRQQEDEDKGEIAGLLYQLVRKSKENELSAETYDELCKIILNHDQSLATQKLCYKTIAARGRQGHVIPSIVFETITTFLQHPVQAIREIAFNVLMTCVARKENRLNIPTAYLVTIVRATQQALSDKNPTLNQYSACIAAYLVQDERVEPEGWQELCDPLKVKNISNLQQDLRFDFLVNALLNPQSCQFALLPLADLLNTNKQYSLLNDSHDVLRAMIKDTHTNLDLKKNALKLLELSIRNSGNSFSTEEEWEPLKQNLQQKNPQLIQSTLKVLNQQVENVRILYNDSPQTATPAALSDDEESDVATTAAPANFIDHRLSVLPDDIMPLIFRALRHNDTALDAIKLIKSTLANADAKTAEKILFKFLVHGEEMIMQTSKMVFRDQDSAGIDDPFLTDREHRDEQLSAFLTIACELLGTARTYYPDEVTRIFDRLEQIRHGEMFEEEALPQENKHKNDLLSGEERTVYQLFDLIKADKRTNKSILKRFKKGHFRCQLEAINFAAEYDSDICPINKPIKTWDEEDCLVWAKCLKSQTDLANAPDMLAEIIAVVSRGNQLSSTHQPRDTQLISLLVMLDAKDKGRLAQIATGEGKSTIVAMLAAIKALQGQTVDVVSSSPILAYRDAEEKADFFSLFDLTVGSNWDPLTDDAMTPGYKACYGKNIVYGDANHFEFDLLRHEYKKEDTRGTREFETVIVDEVDSMLIDESGKIASLGSFKPMMSELEDLFQSTWIALGQRKQLMAKSDFQFPINPETDEPYTRTEYLTTVLEILILEMLQPEDPITKAPKPKVPPHLKDFARSQAPYWAKSAVMASENYVLGKDYEIARPKDHDIIAPVDYINTGVIHPNSAWDDGLHQFLQIKHDVKFTAENLTASFISNRAFFKRYGKSIFGLTGTLGAEDTRNLLEKVYDVDLAFIPTYKEKDFIEIPGELKDKPEDWLAEVVASVTTEAKNGRSVLVICETINKAKEVEKALREKNIHQIKSYTRSDNDEKLAVADTVMPGDIIIATNLAGRGTDIKTSKEVEKAGGLHVCLTFLPKNRRVQEQAFGRTSRQGHKGSAQLIVNQAEAILPLLAVDPDHQLGHADSIEELKKWRDAVETESIEIVKRFELPKLIFKDHLFTQFCEFTTSLREIDKNKAKLDEVEEQWGFWLKNTLRLIANQDPKDEPQKNEFEAKIQKSFEDFKAEISQAFILGDLKNPCESVKMGIELGHTEQAEKAYQQAIKNDPESIAAVQAHYRLAHLYIARQDKAAAIKELEAAKNLLTLHVIPKLETSSQLPLFYQPKANEKIPDNIKRLHNMIHLLKIQMGHIEQNITVLRHSQRADGRRIQTSSTHWLGHFFDENTRPKDEINELYSAGLPCVFEIQEEPPPKKKKKKGVGAWLRRGFVAIVGVCQVVAGVCLTIAGNPTWGQLLIDMGVSDILFAVRSAIQGTECTWAEYRTHKIVSTAVAFATMGIGILREASTTTPGIANVSKQQLVRSQIKQAIVRGVIREGLNYGVDAIARGMIADHKEEIMSRARGAIMARLNQEGTKKLIDEILLVDLLNKNHNQTNKLLQLANNIIQPKQNSFATICESIFKGVASNTVPGMGLLFKAQDLARALEKVANLCDNFCDDFCSRLAGIAHQLPQLSAEQKAEYEPYLNSSRAQLYDTIVNQVTQAMTGTLRHGVVAPLLNTVFTDNIDKKIGQIQDKQLTEEIIEIRQRNEKMADHINNTQNLLLEKPKPSALGTYQEEERNQLQSLLQQTSIRREETLRQEARLEASGQTCPWKVYNNQTNQQTGFSAQQMTCISHIISKQASQLDLKRREEIRAEKAARDLASQHDVLLPTDFTFMQMLDSGLSVTDAISNITGHFSPPMMTRIPQTAAASNVAPPSTGMSALIHSPNRSFRLSTPDRVIGEIAHEIVNIRLPLNQTTTDIVWQSAMKPIWQIYTPLNHTAPGKSLPSHPYINFIAGMIDPMNALIERGIAASNAIEGAKNVIENFAATYIKEPVNRHLREELDFSLTLHQLGDQIVDDSPTKRYLLKAAIIAENDFPLAGKFIAAGLLDALGNVGHTILHPWDTLVEPTAAFLYDTTVLLAHVPPRHETEMMFIAAQTGNVDLYQKLQQQIEQRQNSLMNKASLHRMSERVNILGEAIKTVTTVNNFERMRIAASLGTTIALTHQLAEGVVGYTKSRLAGVGESIVDAELLGVILETEAAQFGIVVEEAAESAQLAMGAMTAGEAGGRLEAIASQAAEAIESNAPNAFDKVANAFEKAEAFTDATEPYHHTPFHAPKSDHCPTFNFQDVLKEHMLLPCIPSFEKSPSQGILDDGLDWLSVTNALLAIDPYNIKRSITISPAAEPEKNSMRDMAIPLNQKTTDRVRESSKSVRESYIPLSHTVIATVHSRADSLPIAAHLQRQMIDQEPLILSHSFAETGSTGTFFPHPERRENEGTHLEEMLDLAANQSMNQIVSRLLQSINPYELVVPGLIIPSDYLSAWGSFTQIGNLSKTDLPIEFPMDTLFPDLKFRPLPLHFPLTFYEAPEAFLGSRDIDLLKNRCDRIPYLSIQEAKQLSKNGRTIDCDYVIQPNINAEPSILMVKSKQQLNCTDHPPIRIHHGYIAGKLPALMAEQVQFSEGELTRIDNGSGHFRPPALKDFTETTFIANGAPEAAGKFRTNPMWGANQHHDNERQLTPHEFLQLKKREEQKPYETSLWSMPKSGAHFMGVQQKIDDFLNSVKHIYQTIPINQMAHSFFSDISAIPIFINNAPETAFLYRGTGRSPTKVFAQGFSARGDNLDLSNHIVGLSHTMDQSAYISTSASKRIASTYPKFSRRNDHFLYEINYQPESVDIAREPKIHSNSLPLISIEKEIAVPFKIEPQDIKGAWPIDRHHGFNMEDILYNHEDGVKNTFIENPHYQPPKSVLMMQTVKSLGHAATAVGAVIDGVSLFNSYLDSLKYDDYHIFGQESARVAGGWTGAFAVGNQFARASAAVCTPFGFYGPPVCGVVGGVTGSVLGYMGGSSLATDAYDALRDSSSLVEALFSNGQANPSATELSPTHFMPADNHQASDNQPRLPRSSARFFDNQTRQRNLDRLSIVSEFQTTQPSNTAETSFFGDVVSFFIPSAEAAEPPKPRAKPIQCQRPDFDDALIGYERVAGYGSLRGVGEVIGGKVQYNFEHGIFENGCAIRAIYAAFNSPEVRSQVACKIPAFKSTNGKVLRGETVTGGDGLQYIYRVDTLVKFLTEVWGPPDYDSRKDHSRKGAFTNINDKGLAITLHPEAARAGYTGHAQITNGIFEVSPVIFWRLPSKVSNTPAKPRAEEPIYNHEIESEMGFRPHYYMD